MSWFETKIPPPLVMLITAAAMFFLARAGLGWRYPLDDRDRYGALALGIVAGLGLAIAGIREFRRAKTSPDPRAIDKASSLVTGGIYRYTRNPMYLGLTIVLIGWTVFLARPVLLLGPLAFVLYITRFQIAPEERTMRAKFGRAYASYTTRVRRWL